MNIRFKKWDCVLDKKQYINGGTALRLLDTLDGSLVAHATAYIETVLEDDEIVIKDYSENEGMLDTLILAGVVAKPHRTIKQGFVEFPICKLLI